MREIKFRVWDGEQMVSPDYINRDGYACWKSNSIPESSKDIMQFIWLKDRNGEEIYEGDILKHRYEVEEYDDDGYPVGVIEGIDYLIGYVYFSSVYNAWGFDNINKYLKYLDPEWLTTGAKHHSFLRYNPDDYEVIGNIYENPELIKS
jgi:uncharacterized phage protein (TIGR01671 family)